MPLSGVFPALATTFTPEGSLDVATLDRLVDFLFERGAEGLCIGGATSEYPHVETEERLQILRRVARRAPKGATLLAAIGAPSVPRVLELGRAALAEGYRAVLLPMPLYFRYQQGDLAAYCAEIASRLGGPCLVYDLPLFTNGIEPQTTLRLLESEQHIVGLKDSSGQVEHLLQFAEARGNRDWTLLIGDDRYGLASAEAGWDGAISGLACCCPELLVALHRSARRGEVEQARRCQALVDELITHLAPLPAPWGVRIALRGRGIDTGPLPLPLSPERVLQIARLESWLPGWLASAEIPNLLPADRRA